MDLTTKVILKLQRFTIKTASQHASRTRGQDDGKNRKR